MKNNLIKNLFLLVFISFVAFSPFLIFADGTQGDLGGSGASGRIENPISSETINDFIKVILEGVIKIGIPIIALALVYCGFLFVSARGNSEKIGKAKDALIYTVIGAAILLGSWAIAQVISETVLKL